MSDLKEILKENKNIVKKKRRLQWILLWAVVLTIGLAWRDEIYFRAIAFVVPVAMMTGMIGGFLNGRWVCGNLCPRGAFWDRITPKFSRKIGIPKIMRNMPLRWIIFSALMGFMAFNLLRGDITDWKHWAFVFWLMCTVTTVIGLILMFLFELRGWCSICPVGTFGNAIGGGINQLQIDSENCKGCLICEKVCPMKLPIIIEYKDSGVMSNRDCIKCNECIGVCPKNVLSFKK